MPKQVYVPRFPNPLTLGPENVLPATDQEDWDFNGLILLNRVVLTPQTFWAPVQLPQGAVITKLKLFGGKNAAGGKLEIILYRQDRVGGTSALATVTAPNWAGYGDAETTTIATPIIDNESYAYGLSIEIDPDAAVSDHGFAGALIYWS